MKVEDGMPEQDEIIAELIEVLIKDFSIKDLTDVGTIFTTLEEYMGLTPVVAAPLILGAIAVRIARKGRSRSSLIPQVMQ